MSTNGVNTSEDTEMADCDGEKVVTMMDVLQEQQDFEEDANAVLGASDDNDCTYSNGYIKRQAIYACLTCCSDAKADASKRAGVCLACSLSCHENHELIELYTKRNFRCDCGNPKFNSHPCQFNPNKTEINEDNKYNQNYSGIYCICHRPYPDPESTIEDEMIQCIICEDWLHASHLDAVVPPNDQYSEMICKGCMEKNEFIHDYSNFAVTGDNVDVDIINTNEVTTSNDHTSESVLETSKENGEQDRSVGVEVEDDSTKNNTEDPINTTKCGITENSCEKQPTLGTVSDIVASVKEGMKEIDETQLLNENEVLEDGKQTDIPKQDSINSTQEVTDKINSHDESGPSAENKTDEQSENIISVSTSKSDNDEGLKKTEEEKEVLNNEETSDHTVTTNVKETETICGSEDQKGENMKGVNTNIETSSNKQPEDKLSDTSKYENSDSNTVTDISKNAIVNNTEEAKLQDTGPENPQLLDDSNTVTDISENAIVNDTEESKLQDTGPENPQLLDDSNTVTDISENAIVNDTEEAKLQDTGPENPQLLNESNTIDMNTNKLDTTHCANDSNNENESSEIDNITEGNDLYGEIETVNKNDDPYVDIIRQEGHSSTENKVPNETIPNTNDNKRKLSMDVKDNVETKKVKVDEENTCIRPKGEKRYFKGATFWPSNFRQKLCMCNECLSMYKDLSVLFLIDPEDTVSAYEMLGKEKTEGSPSSQYEKGLQALSSLDRIQQINALTEYNKMRDKLLDFLKSFKDRREIVKEEDIKGFFAGMKPKREPDGVYFCR